MSAPNDDRLDPVVASYVAAFRKVETPSEATASRTWAAISVAMDPRPRWHKPAVAVVALLAAAAAVALWLGRPWTATRHADASKQQAPHERSDARDGGEAISGEPSQAARRAPHIAELPTAAPGVDAEATQTVPPTADPGIAEQLVTEVERDDGAFASARTTHRRARDPKPTTTVDDSLAAETKLWKAAQSQIAAGQWTTALTTIASWEDRFARGRFSDERALLQARALCGAGRRDDAIALRDAFVAKHPASSLAARMRKVCSEDAP